MRRHALRLAPLLALASSPTPATAQEGGTLEERLSRLEADNAALRERIASLEAGATRLEEQVTPMLETGTLNPTVDFLGRPVAYSYGLLDHAENVNSKPLFQLQAMRQGQLDKRVTLSAGMTVIADWQTTNTDDKFGYLMRHPTASNQLGKHVSEAVIHAAAIGLTGRITDDVTAYAELLYDPEQSFGSGTITDLNRNQIQLRRGYLMWGNLDKRPVYALAGKFDIPFGLNDTVSPFTNSTNWHAFAGLAYGAELGWFDGLLHVRAMAVQGGAQFRAANLPRNGTQVPSHLGNFAIDGRIAPRLGDWGEVMVGASYLKGSAYCQGYPVLHFMPCEDNVPAFALYGKARVGRIDLLADFARTTRVWPGTAVPDPSNPLSLYAPRKAKALTLGARARFGSLGAVPGHERFALSGEFSRFVSGEDGSPWEQQKQIVAGLSWFASPRLNLFGELIHTDGYVPLNFLSGGNFEDGSTHSTQDANSEVVLVGAQAAF